MTSDVRQGSGGRGGDDWLGSGDLDWGEQSSGTTRPRKPPPRTSGSGPGEPPWPGDDPDPHPDEAIYRRRRMIGLIVLVLAVGFVILVAVLAFGGGGSGNDNAVTLQTSTAQQTPPPPPPPPATTPKTSTTPQTGATPGTTPGTTPDTTTSGQITLAEGQSLKTGDSGDQVIQLQQALTQLGYAPGAADGSFGATTANAVGEFQRAHDLADDGVAGPATVAAINAALTGGTSSTATSGAA